MMENKSKRIAWDILECCILWYEGADPTYYGYPKTLSDIGRRLSDALYLKVERLLKEASK